MNANGKISRYDERSSPRKRAVSMRTDLPSLPALLAFETVARRLSFARAAEELHLTPSAVSHQIAKLELFLGFTLFERNAKGVALSRAGENYLKRIAGALGVIADATSDTRLGGMRNTLNIHSSPSIASQWLMPRLGQFARAYPEISLSLSASPRHSDFALGQVDVDIRYGVPEWPNLIVDPVFEERIMPLASPRFLAQHPIKKPADLLGLPLIQSSVSLIQWPAWFANRGLIGVQENYLFRFDRAYLSLEAAVQGLGISLESQQIAETFITRRLLKPVFKAAWSLPLHGHFIVYPEVNARRIEVKRFIAWIKEQASPKKSVEKK